ncbi:tryptophan--tRNA ligase [Candidatus Uhrbacteria bacterium]|jgi:tryptophanyl-tRNA synthetase|nr:tryptophan--tRNA ligase [Candidatus Uhrbacteria bacterium]
MNNGFLSGIQPSNLLHIGNYFGAIKQFVDFQNDREGIIMIADLHALTSTKDPKKLRENTLMLAATYLAAGLDAEKNVLFQQSDVPQHSELNWVFSSLMRMSELERMTQYKDKAIVHGENVNVGIFTYPLLMAGDILLYSPLMIPVGDDQKQHVELTRDIAERFNKTYGDTFKVPEVQITKVGARIMGLDDPTKKMSKSAESAKNYIALTDEPDVIRKKIMSAVTDDIGVVNYTDDQPGVKNLLDILSLIKDRDPEDLARDFEGKGYGDLKKEVAEALVEFLTPIRSKILAYMANADELKKVLADGAERARVIAEAKMVEVKNAVGLTL